MYRPTWHEAFLEIKLNLRHGIPLCNMEHSGAFIQELGGIKRGMFHFFKSYQKTSLLAAGINLVDNVFSADLIPGITCKSNANKPRIWTAPEPEKVS